MKSTLVTSSLNIFRIILLVVKYSFFFVISRFNKSIEEQTPIQLDINLQTPVQLDF